MELLNLERLKTEIKAEILKEINQKPQAEEQPWDKVKKEILHQIEQSEHEIDSVGVSQLVNIVSAIVRKRFRLRYARFLSEGQFPEALEIAHRVLDLAGFERKEGEKE